MYEAFYGLRERPFDSAVDPRFLFTTANHREALTALEYGTTTRGAITVLVGPAGTGKTMLVRAVLAGRKPDAGCVVCLTNPLLTRGEFLELLAHEFHLSAAAAASKASFLIELRERLVEEHTKGAVGVLVVDEAHLLSSDLFEEVRLLTNLEAGGTSLLSVVLVGQPELADLLKGPARSLNQRVALRATLAPLDPADIVRYVAERIQIAGGSVSSVFSSDAIAAVCECSAGIPRTIGLICESALVSGFALDQRPVDRSIVVEVSRELELTTPGGHRSELPTVEPAMIARALALSNVPFTPTLIEARALAPVASERPSNVIGMAPIRLASVTRNHQS